MAQTAAEVRLTKRGAERETPPRDFIRRTVGALREAMRRSDERLRLGSALSAAEVGRQTGVRC